MASGADVERDVRDPFLILLQFLSAIGAGAVGRVKRTQTAVAGITIGSADPDQNLVSASAKLVLFKYTTTHGKYEEIEERGGRGLIKSM